MTTPSELRQFQILDQFDDLKLRRLGECATTKLFGPGSTLFCADEASTECYLVGSGAVSVRRDTPFGPFEVVSVGPGELLGEVSFVDSAGRTGEARTTVATEVHLLDPTLLRAACQSDLEFDQAFHWALWKSLSAKLRATNERLAAYFTGEATPSAGSIVLPQREIGSGSLDLEGRRTLFREQPLSAMEINFLATLSREERYPPGGVIFNQGAEGSEMFVVVEGQVVISTDVQGAGEEALSFLERGEYFGEMALIDRLPRSADAKAHPDTGAVVLAIPGEVASGILAQGKMSSIRLLKILCRLVARRVRQIDEKLLGWFLLSGGEEHERSARVALGG